VPVLGGAPGVHSARFGGLPKSDEKNNQCLIERLSGYSDPSDRVAYYYCVLVMVRSESDPQPVIADGCWYGEIAQTPRGSQGFGYDPYFYIPSLQKTVAELASEQKIACRTVARH